MPSSKIKIDTLILSDGTKGMENQSVAISKYLNLNYKILTIKPNFLLKNFPKITNFFYIFFKFKINFLNYYSFKYLITTGKRMSGYSILVKKIFKKKICNIHIQYPKIHPSNFDILIVPKHDKISGKNVFKTDGSLVHFSQKEINNSFNIIKQKISFLKTPLVLLLIGGDNKRYKLTYTQYCNFFLDVRKAVKNISGSIVVSTSRRTPKKVELILKHIFKSFHKNFYLFNEKDHHTYPGILKKTDYAIVTSDSINMISEIASTEVMLFVGYLREEKTKLQEFNKYFEKKSYSKKFDGMLFKYNKNKLETNYKLKKKIMNYKNIFLSK